MSKISVRNLSFILFSIVIIIASLITGLAWQSEQTQELNSRKPKESFSFYESENFKNFGQFVSSQAHKRNEIRKIQKNHPSHTKPQKRPTHPVISPPIYYPIPVPKPLPEPLPEPIILPPEPEPDPMMPIDPIPRPLPCPVCKPGKYCLDIVCPMQTL